VCVCEREEEDIYIYIYIYVERERERERPKRPRERERERERESERARERLQLSSFGHALSKTYNSELIFHTKQTHGHQKAAAESLNTMLKSKLSEVLLKSKLSQVEKDLQNQQQMMHLWNPFQGTSLPASSVLGLAHQHQSNYYTSVQLARIKVLSFGKSTTARNAEISALISCPCNLAGRASEQ